MKEQQNQFEKQQTLTKINKLNKSQKMMGLIKTRLGLLQKQQPLQNTQYAHKYITKQTSRSIINKMVQEKNQNHKKKYFYQKIKLNCNVTFMAPEQDNQQGNNIAMKRSFLPSNCKYIMNSRNNCKSANNNQEKYLSTINYSTIQQKQKRNKRIVGSYLQAINNTKTNLYNHKGNQLNNTNYGQTHKNNTYLEDYNLAYLQPLNTIETQHLKNRQSPTSKHYKILQKNIQMCKFLNNAQYRHNNPSYSKKNNLGDLMLKKSKLNILKKQQSTLEQLPLKIINQLPLIKNTFKLY